MSNKASNQVHELIHALTPAEKRYFKLFAERHSGTGKNNYLRLFEAIEKQEDYDEDALLKKFRKSPFVNHFSIAKNRLYHQILRSLDAFHAESSVDAEIRSYLHYVEILFHKNLHRQCSRLLNTAQKLASKYQNHDAGLRILKWQKKLVETKNHEVNEPEIIHEQDRIIERLEAENTLWKLKSEVFSDLFRSGQIRDDQKAKDTRKILQKLEEYAVSDDDFETAYLMHHVRSAVFFSLSDYAACKEELLANRSLIERNLHIAKDDPLSYHSVLINLIYVSAKLNDMDAVRNFLAESRDLPTKLKIASTPYIDFRLFSDTYGLELAICSLTANTERGKELIETIPTELHKWEAQLSDVKKAAFLHGLSVMHFTLGDFNGALKRNNELLNTVKMDHAEDQVLFAHMMHAILHFELGHIDLLSSIEKSLTRYLETREKRYRFETHFLNLVHCLRRQSGKKAISKCFEKFKEEITPLEQEPFEKVAFEFFDFVAWAESAIESSSYREHVAERSHMRNVL